jgi:hypothetical protein
MTISKILLISAISAGIATTIIAAECRQNHQNCSHQHASGNVWLCRTEDAVICDYQTNENHCNGLDAMEIMNNFPASCIDCNTYWDSMLNYYHYTCHHNCNEILTNCYRTVQCEWNTEIQKCVIKSG